MQHLLRSHSEHCNHTATTSTKLCLTTLNCKGRQLPLEALVVSLGCVLLYNGPVGLLLCTAGPLNGGNADLLEPIIQRILVIALALPQYHTSARR